jgi:phage/plasmid-associated DNA primase
MLRLDPHRPDLISKVANVAYDPDAADARCTTSFSTVQPDEAMRRFLHQWGGLSLTGDISEQKLAFFMARAATANRRWSTMGPCRGRLWRIGRDRDVP